MQQLHLHVQRNRVLVNEMRRIECALRLDEVRERHGVAVNYEGGRAVEKKLKRGSCGGAQGGVLMGKR